jgi:hypothetical protein
MESISDLTRDTRPSLRELLISSIYDTIEMEIIHFITGYYIISYSAQCYIIKIKK